MLAEIQSRIAPKDKQTHTHALAHYTHTDLSAMAPNKIIIWIKIIA